MAQIDSIEECQCHAYHALAKISAIVRNRAPIAQPHLSPTFPRAIPAGNLERLVRRLSTIVWPVIIRCKKKISALKLTSPGTMAI
jgi:hypothetical protein